MSRYVLDSLGAGDVQSLSRRLGRDAARLRRRGRGDAASSIDATLSVDAAGGAFPFWQTQADGLERRLLRVPVAVDDVPGEGPAAALAAGFVALRRNRGSGAPTLVELTPDRHGCAGAVERALLADTPPDVWRGTLDAPRGVLGAARGHRAGRPAAGRRPRLARARLAASAAARGQSLVAPFPVARATGADGHPLGVRGGNRVLLPAVRGETAVVIVPARAKVNRSGDPASLAFRQAATRLPRQLTRLSSSANVCR